MDVLIRLGGLTLEELRELLVKVREVKQLDSERIKVLNLFIESHGQCTSVEAVELLLEVFPLATKK